MINETEKAFLEAYEKEKKKKIKLASDVMLRLYAYYKQATVAYSHHFEHQELDLIRSFKFNAWQQVNHLTAEEAKISYIELVNSLKL